MKRTQYEPDKMQEKAFAAIANAPLNATELAALWNSYMQYTMFNCVFKQFSQTADDKDVRLIMEDTVNICTKRVAWVAEIFNKEGLPIPIGFSDDDVNWNAPRLFTDAYFLYYLINSNKIAVGINGLSLVTSGRSDVRGFFTHCVDSSMHLFNNAADILLSKGLYVRPPIVSVVKIPSYVKKQDFLGGFLGERRSLLAQEISALFYGIITNNVGKRLLMGFRQTTDSNEVRKYMDRGVNMANNLIDTFSASLTRENVPDPIPWDFMVTDSTTPIFSDKLMMYHTVMVTSAGILNYAASMATSPRHDLMVNYFKAIAEVANYLEDGTNIMIENGWYEEPFRTVDRRDLLNKPEH
ncbi:MAG TPA: DUF3231 family protein [Syntrophomonas sp.]|jgi:hypothetical protein|nr:DUF3231 family protein [Syntrophomonas sp.]